ncbi:MAG: hypothetical protein ACYCSA_10005 [Thermoplasmataceae archaeon]
MISESIIFAYGIRQGKDCRDNFGHETVCPGRVAFGRPFKPEGKPGTERSHVPRGYIREILPIGSLEKGGNDGMFRGRS